MYHERMEHNNSLNKDIKMDDNNPGLSYETYQEQVICISKVADPPNNTLNKCVLIECLISSPSHGQTVHPVLGSPHIEDIVININLSYDLNTPMEPELWDGNFYPILLHSSMKHLVLDSKNIKDSLNFIAKYISNKQVDSSKSNDIKDFHSIGKTIWNFISSVYQDKWDSLYVNKYSNILRKKISAKFTPKILSVPNKSNKATDKLTLVSIEKIPSISTKSQKKVNQISKYFKNIKLAEVSKQP